MNEYPPRNRNEREPDEYELEDDAFDDASLDAELEQSVDDEFDLDDTDLLGDEEEDIEIPSQYVLADQERRRAEDEEAGEVAAGLEAALPDARTAVFGQEYVEEPGSVPARSFDQQGPFAAPEPAERRQARRSLPAAGAEEGRRQPFAVFRPESNSGTLLGIAAVVICVVLGLGLLLKSFSYSPGLSQFWPLVIGALLLFLGALFAYWTWGSLTLRYVVDRNALTIRWGAQRQVVPLANIERLIPAGAEGEAPDVQGVDWPGHHVGRAFVQQLGEVLFYSGHRSAADILYVQTASETYAVSVPDPVSFAESIQANQIRGPLFDQRQAVQRDGIAAQSFWLDPQARFLTVVLLGVFVMVLGYVLATYPDLAQSVPLRYPALGGLLRVTDKSELLDIPRSAAAFLGLNLLLAVLLHPWERMVSIVLLLAGISIQIALLVAAIVAVA